MGGLSMVCRWVQKKELEEGKLATWFTLEKRHDTAPSIDHDLLRRSSMRFDNRYSRFHLTMNELMERPTYYVPLLVVNGCNLSEESLWAYFRQQLQSIKVALAFHARGQTINVVVAFHVVSNGLFFFCLFVH